MSLRSLTPGRPRTSLTVVLALVAGMAPLALDGPAVATPASARSTTFVFTGAEQEYVVPEGATSLRIVAVGARGGEGGLTYCAEGTCSLSQGGVGAAVDAVFAVCSTCAVRPGQTLYVEVGGDGGSGSLLDSAGPTPGGFNGGGQSLRGNGGGGGGASDVRTVAGAASYSSRLVVAGGGGGGGSHGNVCGAHGWSIRGGDGGSAGMTTAGAGSDGGYESCGGGTDGGGGGGGATQSSGGAGGTIGKYRHTCNPGDPGTSGSLGQGGSGGWESNFTGGRAAATGGGGGGGGYYGGGGGAGGTSCGAYDTVGAGGGGGGSSFVAEAASQHAEISNPTGVAKIELVAMSTTTTTLSCQPTSTALGATTTCTATVTDDDAAPVTPTGTVTFSSTGAGTFGSATCTLNEGSCSTTYAPSGNAGRSDTISALYSGDIAHTAGDDGSAVLPVDKGQAAIAIDNLPSTAVYGDSFTPTYTQTGDGTPTVTSLTTNTCTVTDDTVDYVGAGTCELKPSASATTNYTAATGTTQTFTIAKAPAAITIDNLPSTAVYGDSFTPTYTQTGDGTPTVTSLTTSTCTVTDGTVSFDSEGSCDLRASASATADYTAATGATQTLAVYAAPAVSLDPVSRTVTTRQPVTFRAEAQSTQPVTVQWQVSTDAGAHWSDIVSANDSTLTVTASLAQSGNRYRATFTSLAGTTIGAAATLTVTRIPLTVTASSATMRYAEAGPSIEPQYGALAAGDTLDTVVLTQPRCWAHATPSSPVGTYPSECSGGSFDADYAVTYLTGSVSVTPAPQTIVSTTVVPRHPVAGRSLRITAVPGASNTPISYAVNASSDQGACFFRSARVLRLAAIGTCIVDLSQPASHNYQATTSQLRIVIDTTKPSWRSPRKLERGRVGSRYVTRLKLKGTPRAKVRVTRGTLPRGLRLHRNLRLSGRPVKAGKYSFVLTAKNRAGTTKRKFRVRVAHAHRRHGPRAVQAAASDGR